MYASLPTWFVMPMSFHVSLSVKLICASASARLFFAVKYSFFALMYSVCASTIAEFSVFNDALSLVVCPH